MVIGRPLLAAVLASATVVGVGTVAVHKRAGGVLEDTHWRLMSVGAPGARLDGSPTLDFGRSGSYSADDGVHEIRGDYRYTAGTTKAALAMSETSSTLVGSASAPAQAAFASMLNGASEVTQLDDDRLVVRTDTSTLVFFPA